MDNNNPSAGSGQGNNFFSGFLLGALIGAGLVFLLGTKKGKKLLKAISENGIDNISNTLEEKPSFSSRDKKAASFAEVATKAETEEQREKTIEEKPKVRRFFRGISRHVN